MKQRITFPTFRWRGVTTLYPTCRIYVRNKERSKRHTWRNKKSDGKEKINNERWQFHKHESIFSNIQAKTMQILKRQKSQGKINIWVDLFTTGGRAKRMEYNIICPTPVHNPHKTMQTQLKKKAYIYVVVGSYICTSCFHIHIAEIYRIKTRHNTKLNIYHFLSMYNW